MSSASNPYRKLRNPYERQPEPSSPLDFRLMPYESHTIYENQHPNGLYSLLDPSRPLTSNQDPSSSSISNPYSPRKLLNLVVDDLKTPRLTINGTTRNSIDNSSSYSPRKLLNYQAPIVTTTSPRLSQARQGFVNPYDIENTSNRLLYGHLDPYDRVRSPKRASGLNPATQESSSSPSSSTNRSLMASLRFYDTQTGLENTPNGSQKPWKSSQSQSVDQFQSPYDRYDPYEKTGDRSSPYDRLSNDRTAVDRGNRGVDLSTNQTQNNGSLDRSDVYDRSNPYSTSSTDQTSPNWALSTNLQSVVGGSKEVVQKKGLALSYMTNKDDQSTDFPSINKLANETQQPKLYSSSALQVSPAKKVRSLLDPVDLDETISKQPSGSNLNDHGTLRQQGNPYKQPPTSSKEPKEPLESERLSSRQRQNQNPYQKLPSAPREQNELKEPNSERLSLRQSYNPYDKLPSSNREQFTERQSLRQSYNPYEKTAGTQNQYDRQPIPSSHRNAFERQSLVDQSRNEIGLLTTLPLRNLYETSTGNAGRSSVDPYGELQMADQASGENGNSFGKYSQSSPNLYDEVPSNKQTSISNNDNNNNNKSNNDPYQQLSKPKPRASRSMLFDNHSSDSEYEDLNLPSPSKGLNTLQLNPNFNNELSKTSLSPYERQNIRTLHQDEDVDELLNLYKDQKEEVELYGERPLNPYESSKPYGSSKTSLNPYDSSSYGKTGQSSYGKSKQTKLGKPAVLSPTTYNRLPKPSSLPYLLLKLAYKSSPGLNYKTPPGLAPRSPNPYEEAKKQSQFEQQKKEYYQKNSAPKVIIDDDPIIPDFPVQETFKKSSRYNMKIVVVGDGGCGKTCLLVSYVQNKFPEIYVPTVFENYVTNVLAPNQDTIELALWDTAGQEEYERLRPLSYPNVDVLLVCFSLESVVSLQNVKDMWFPEVSYFCPGIPIVLVGTKSDLNSSIDPDLPIQLATEINAIGYVLCSAKHMFNIKTVFNFAIDHFLKQQRMNEQMERLKNRLSKHFGGHSRNQSSVLHQRHASGHMKNSSFDSALLLDQPLGEDTYKSNPYGNFNNHKYQDNDLAFALDDRGKKKKKGKKCTIL